MSLTKQQLHGVWVAMVTPWDEAQGAPRRDVLARLADRFAQAGVNGLFILGNTGEGALLSPEERRCFTEAVLQEVKEKLPVIVHTGHDRTSVAVELAVHAKTVGAFAVAVSAPARYRLDESELEAHFVEVAQALGDFPMLLYDVPSTTGNPLSATLLIRISAQAFNVVGIKVSRPDWEAWEQYLALTKSMAIFVGTDTLCLPMLMMGASGIISGPANVLPELYVQLYYAIREKNFDKAKECQNLINQLCRIIHNGVPLAFIKQGLKLTSYDVGYPLKPLRHLLPDEYEELQKNLLTLVNKFNLFAKGVVFREEKPSILR